MFSLIVLGAVATTSTISSILGGAALVTGAAIGVKKYSDYVEEENARIVNRSHRQRVATEKKLQTKAVTEICKHKEARDAKLKKQIEASDMNPADKKACLSYTGTALIRKNVKF